MTHLGESLWMVSGSRFKGKIRWSVGSKGIIRVITEDMASWLRAFATIAEDPGLGLSMHTMVYNLSIPGNLTSSSYLYKYLHRRSINTHTLPYTHTDVQTDTCVRKEEGQAK